MSASWRRTAGACCLATCTAAFADVGASSQGPVSLDQLLERAKAYVADYERTFSAVVSEERYVQRLMGGGATETRQLRSDLILMTAGDGAWLIFRDVYEVDG